MRVRFRLTLMLLLALFAIAAGNAQAPAATTQFFSTTCTSDDQCPAGQKCCYPCGIPDCEFVCMEVERNRCPLIP